MRSPGLPPSRRLALLCWDCVRDYAEVDIGEWSDRHGEIVRELVDLPVVLAAWECHRFYQLPGCANGGPLHVVLDDSNVDDQFLRVWEPWFDEGWGCRMFEYDEDRFPAEEPWKSIAEQVAVREIRAQAEEVVVALRQLPAVKRAVAVNLMYGGRVPAWIAQPA